MEFITGFFGDHWLQLSVIYLLFAKFITGLRDALDKTPDSDDNWFERIATVVSKLAQYLTLGKRS